MTNTANNEDAIRNIVRDVVRQVLIESPAAPSVPAAYAAPWTGVEYDSHPSRQSFNLHEATVTIGELLDFVEAARCSIETDKPCDHCGMCKTLGF
jgi:hypothetical protein